MILRLFSIIVCKHFDYGFNCSSKCGNCKDNSVCNHVNGSCPDGCAVGYEGLGDKCDKGLFCIDHCVYKMVSCSNAILD